MLSMALLVAGTSIGAGTLGVPVTLGLAGAGPALSAMLLAWVVMMGTGWILSLAIIKSGQPGLEITSLYRLELGTWAARLASLVYLVLFHSLLVAYLTGTASVLASLLGRPQGQKWFMLVFFLAAGGLTVFGLELVRRCNLVFMLLLAAAFALLVGLCLKNYQITRLSYQNWAFLPGAFPIILCAFGFHNIMPLTCQALDLNRRRIALALAVGTGLALAVGTGLAFLCNALWVLAVAGSLPMEEPGQANLLAAYKLNQPATVPLAAALHSHLVTWAGLVFSLMAIITSYVGVGVALISFMRDLLSSWGRVAGRPLLSGLALLPSLVISLLYPGLFLQALNLVGGGCLILLFGILPSLMLLKRSADAGKARRVLGWLLLAGFGAFLCLELLQEMGWLLIRPEMDHWVINIPGLD